MRRSAGGHPICDDVVALLNQLRSSRAHLTAGAAAPAGASRSEAAPQHPTAVTI